MILHERGPKSGAWVVRRIEPLDPVSFYVQGWPAAHIKHCLECDGIRLGNCAFALLKLAQSALGAIDQMRRDRVSFGNAITRGILPRSSSHPL
jgi:hypothetical protein